MPAARYTTEIQAPLSVVMATITDFRAYPSFLPDMRAADVVREGEGVWEVRFALTLIRELSYTLKLTQIGPNLLDWTLLEGAFRSNEGGWVLTPSDDGQRTHAEYRIDVSLATFVPGGILRSLVERSLPETLRRFKAEAERRARGQNESV